MKTANKRAVKTMQHELNLLHPAEPAFTYENIRFVALLHLLQASGGHGAHAND